MHGFVKSAQPFLMTVLAGQGPSNPQCPPIGQFFQGATLTPPNVATLNLGAGPTEPAANYSRVPVMHYDRPDLDPHLDPIEAGSPWFYIVKGSAVWMDIGRTIVFDSHADAVWYFLQEKVTTHPTPHKQLVRVAPVARRMGFDSIQYLKHCDNRCGCIGTELVLTKPASNPTCPSTFYDTIDSTTPCTCTSSMAYSNCNGNTIAPHV